MTKLKRLTRLLKTRRRKILAVILTLLLLLTSLRLYFFLNPKEIRAATVELSTTSTTVQIDVAHRYRAIMTTNDTDDYLVLQDRGENDSSPDEVLELWSLTVKNSGTAYRLGYDNSRKTTILDATDTRVKIRVEGCFDTTGGGTCLQDDGTDDTIEITEEYTFTSEGIFISTFIDFKDGLTLGSGDYVYLIDGYFNEAVSTAHDEEVVYGDGETEGTRDEVDGNGALDPNDDIYAVLQGNNDYQDIIIGTLDLNGDKRLSNGNDSHDYYAIDSSGEADEVIFYENEPQTISGQGQAHHFIQFHPQNELNTETEREAMFNDLTNPDYLSHVTGDLWDDKPYGDFIFASDFESGDSNLCDGGDGWDGGSCESGNTAVGNDASTVYDGNYAAKFTSTGTNDLARPYKNLGNTYGTLYARFYFRLDYEDLDASGEQIYLMMFQDSVAWQANSVNIKELSGGDLFIVWEGPGGYYDTSASIQLDTWYELEMKVYRHASAGTAELWLNGKNIYSGSGLNTGNNDFDYVLAGLVLSSSNTNQLFLDNVIVSESYIGPAHYNEAEGAYTTDMAVSDAEVNIDAGPNTSTLVNDGSVEAGDSTFTVDSTTGFPSSGVAYIEGDKFSYTGKTGTTFTGIPSSGELSIIGHADDSVVSLSRRHSPLYKFRNYRQNDVPQYVTLEQDTLTQGAEFNASVKPFSTSYFAQDLLWHSTLESTSAVTSPDVGTGVGVTNATFTTGKYGNGLLIDGGSEYASLDMENNVDDTTGTIEFWYKLEGTIGNYGAFFGSDEGDNQFQLQRSTADTIISLAINPSFSVAWNPTSVNLFDGEWHHVRLTYNVNYSGSNDSFYLYLDGVSQGEETGTGATPIDLTGYDLQIGTNGSAGSPGMGVYDDFRIYDTVTSPDPIAKGGNTTDSDEYLADPVDDYTFDFNNDDTDNRGEYIWLGSDSPFGGVNTDLATDGVGSSEDFDWEYWDGDSWAALTVTDQDTGAHSFTADGNFYFTPAADWFPYSVNGSTDLYYIRGHLEDGSYSTDPIENRIQTDILLIHYQDNIVDENQTLFVPAITAGPNPPVVYWALDEGYGTTANDASGHGNHGTISGATWQTEDLCYSEKCLYFDGSDDEISRTDDPQFDVNEGGSFSISAWIRHPDISTNPDVIAAKFESTEGDGGYRLQMESDGDISFGIDTDNSSFPEDTVTSTSADFDDNRWHHLAVVKDGNDNLYLYIDGDLIDTDSSISATDSLGNDDDFYLGIDGDGSSNAWAGFIDEFKFYRYARAPLDVKSDYLTGAATRGSSSVLSIRDYSYLSDGLVGYWRMDDADVDYEGETSTDSSGNGNNGTLYGDNGVGDNGTGMDCTVGGKFGTGCNLDGTDDYVSITAPAGSVFDITDNLTLSAWIYPTNSAGNIKQSIIDKLAGSGSYRLFLQANKIYLGVRDSGSNYDEVGTSSIISDNNWYHIAGRVTNNTLTIYVDGQQKAEKGTAIQIANTTHPIHIGHSQNNNQYFTGTVDGVRIYNRALSPAEIADLYHWAPGPVGYWPMDEASWTNDCSTDTVFDRSGNGNHGDSCPNITGPTGGVVGRFGKGAKFSGSNYVTVTDNNIPDKGPATIMAWVYLDTFTDYEGIIGKWGGDPYKYSYNLQAAAGSPGRFLTYAVLDSGDVYYSNMTTASTDAWHHVAAAITDNNVILYVDGIAYPGADAEWDASSFDATLYFGRRNVEEGTYLNDYLDEVKIYNYARTPEQIIEDMNAGHPVGGSPLPSQVAYWTFDEGYGDIAYDQTGNNNGDLAGSGTTCPQSGDSACPSWTNSGKFGKALDFDTAGTTDDYVDTNLSSVELGAGDYSISLWFKADSTTGQRNLFTDWEGGDRSLLLRISDNELQHYVADGSSTLTGNNSISFTDTADWHHVVATHKASTNTLKLFLDGTLRDSDTYTGTRGTSNNDFFIGTAVSLADYFDGKIDEVKAYNITLTAEQVKLDMNQGKAAVWGASSTDSSNNPTWSAQNEYCPPGQGSSCTAPVAEWKFDEKTGTDANDTSENNNTGTLTAGPTWKHAGECQKGACLEFDGSDDYVHVDDDNSLDAVDDDKSFTISGWFKPDDATAEQTIIGKLNFPSNNTGWILDLGAINPNQLRFQQADGSFIARYSNQVFTSGVWHHFAVVHIADSTFAFYRNGVDITSSSSNFTWNGDNGQPLGIGRERDGGGDYEGFIDDIRIYDYARTPAQIAWDYNRGAPVGYWQLDECSGTTAYDASGNSNNGAITIGSSGSNTSAGTCTGSSSEAWYNGATGKRNASLDFDGTNDYIDVGDDPALESDQIGMSAWVYIKGTTGNYQVVAIKGSTDYEISMTSDLHPRFGITNDSSSRVVWDVTSITLSQSTWHHMAMTYDGSTIKAYIDGRYVDSQSQSNGVRDSASGLTIGYHSDSYYLKGQIDDLRIYNYALTPQQIRDIYNEGAVRFGPETGSP